MAINLLAVPSSFLLPPAHLRAPPVPLPLFRLNVPSVAFLDMFSPAALRPPSPQSGDACLCVRVPARVLVCVKGQVAEQL